MIELRPATAEDLRAFAGGPAPTAKAVAGVLDGAVVALGGLAFVDGKVVAFCNVTPSIRKYPVLIHRTALRVMADARRAGHRIIYAQPDPDEKNASKWLGRLGFKPVDENGTLWRWRH